MQPNAAAAAPCVNSNVNSTVCQQQVVSHVMTDWITFTKGHGRSVLLLHHMQAQ